MKSLFKVLNHFRIKIYIKYNEKLYMDHIKYLFIKEKTTTKSLLIVFSGFSGKGAKPKYNYVNSFSKLKMNKLFILDDFGCGGSYYLGQNGDFFVPELVIGLIRNIVNTHDISTIYTAGSSKGGTSAIYYGLKIKADFVFAGACQYFIGDYLNTEERINVLKGILGNVDEKGINRLNNLIHEAITEYYFEEKPIFYLHYSKNEHTYSEHIKPLIEVLRTGGFSIIEDIKNYTSHSEVGKFFPCLVINELGNIAR